jgi:hypothetical protein
MPNSWNNILTKKIRTRMACVKICRRGKEMEATASLSYSSFIDLIQTTKYIG